MKGYKTRGERDYLVSIQSVPPNRQTAGVTSEQVCTNPRYFAMSLLLTRTGFAL